MSISCVIITLNEAAHIKDCIASVLPIVDEVIVIDAHSTDDTVVIAKKAGAKVFLKNWKGYGISRNYGAAHAAHKWILSIDADERVTKELQFKIQNISLNKSKLYAFNRITNYCGQWIRHGSWYPEWKSRLYHKELSRWDDKVVHETLVSHNKLQLEKVAGHLEHYAYKSHQELETRLSKYANLYAQEKLASGAKAPWFKKTLGPTFHFLKSYVFKLGFLDGRAGYNIAKAISTYHLEKYKC